MNAEHSDINKEAWEARSIQYKNDIKSVLFKRFPDILNNHIHNFHKKFILENIPNGDYKILDAGCGYGRNSLPLIERNPDIRITGIDISENFVKQFISNTGKPAYAGTLEKIPDEISKFDYIICVSVLMYVEKKNIDRAIQNMLSHLKKEGKIILIEPLTSGYFFSSGFGILNLFRKKNKTESEHCFKAKELKRHINNNGGIIFSEQRTPMTTIFIIPLYFFSLLMGNTIMNWIFKFISRLDGFLSKAKLPSLHCALVINIKNHE
ncbi:MAG: class I SAM-dependent methyltransferase [Bacteroidetes bacterium]|nr:class I SAM-dependent methyltransferase [Bacteroidota bacterium]